MAVWRICDHAILLPALFHKEYAAPRGKKPPPVISKGSTVASAAGAPQPRVQQNTPSLGLS
eukprot:8863196-Lingulodinium_polyedra.AAC.1